MPISVTPNPAVSLNMSGIQIGSKVVQTTDDLLNKVRSKDGHEREFCQAVEEVRYLLF
jgi:hypothetical protein